MFLKLQILLKNKLDFPLFEKRKSSKGINIIRRSPVAKNIVYMVKLAHRIEHMFKGVIGYYNVNTAIIDVIQSLMQFHKYP